MELVYLWVEDYKNINKQGFNFSPRFHCDYNEEQNELTIKENDDYIENFFGENINVTAIVGKNGSGKSSVLELIINFSDVFKKDYKIFYVIKKENNFIIYHNNFDTNIDCINQKIEQKKFEKNTNEKFILNYSYVSLSPFLNNMDIIYDSINDKSLLASIYNYRDDYKNKTFNYIGFYLAMIPKVSTLLDNNYIKKLFNIQGKPNYLTFKFNKYIEKYFSEDLKKIIQKSEEVEKSEDKYLYEVSLNNLEVIKAINDLYEKIESKKRDIEKENIEFERKLKKDESKGLIPEPSKRIKTEFDKQYDELYNTPYGNSSDNESIQSRINAVRNRKINTNRRKIARNNEVVKKLGTIDFNLTQNKNATDTFYFSSGELVLLFYIKKLIYISQKEEDIILLIDENELYLHPDWQKKFLLFICDLFSDSQYIRQIIIISHSPFLLSDIPIENVIFLKDGKQDRGIKHNQTFGANIHTLLSDSFFMDKGLMGEFAKSKINEIIDFHKEVEKENSDKETLKIKYLENQTKFWQIQSIVGEAYLKQILENHLIEIEKILLGKDGAKASKKARLLAQLRELEDD